MQQEPTYRPPIKEAVVLAAGNGTRMSWHSDTAKPLVRVCGYPLLERVLGELSRLGIATVHVVLGYRADEIKEQIGTSTRSVDVNWVFNPRFDLANGRSLLAIEGMVRPPFLLLMADHLFGPGIMNAFVAQHCPETGGLLAVDRKIPDVFDLSDAVKVKCDEGNRIRAIGKSLADFQAIDTGAFLLSEAIFPALREAGSAGDHSLAAGIAGLAETGPMLTWDIGDGCWIDVDTPEALAHAEKLVSAGFLPRSAH